MNYKICPNCGAHLDPGEPCDCKGKPPVKLAFQQGGKKTIFINYPITTTEKIKRSRRYKPCRSQKNTSMKICRIVNSAD
jgi:hypothetical protein